MQAGKEIDSLIAQKVMNWGPEKMAHFEMTKHVWSPSTNIADAWEVAEKLRSQKCDVHVITVTRLIGDKYSDLWDATVFLPKTNKSYSGASESAAHALCLAALKTIN